MNHSCIDWFGDRAIYFFRIQQTIQHLTGRAYLAPNMIDLGKSRIADMMINTGCLFCRVKIGSCNGQSVLCAHIAGNKKVIFLLTIQFHFNLIHTVNMTKNRFWMIQIHIHLNLRPVGFHI